jgi:hypothetical protein
MEAALDRPALASQGFSRGAGKIRERRLEGAALEEVAAKPEQNRLRPRDLDLGLPLALDPEEKGHETTEGSRGVDEQLRTGERIEGGGLAPVRGEPVGQRGILCGKRREERGIQVREALLAVEVLISESGDAEREVPRGEGGGGAGSLQGMRL